MPPLLLVLCQAQVWMVQGTAAMWRPQLLSPPGGMGMCAPLLILQLPPHQPGHVLQPPPHQPGHVLQPLQ